MAAFVVGLNGSTGGGAGGPRDLLPDLQVGSLYGFELESAPGGRVRLRFGTVGWNVGEGPLEARGRRIDPTDLAMRVRQRIYDSAGGHRDRVTPSVMIYETGDHHDHWHTRQFMVVNMYRRGIPDRNVFGLRKIGYCLLDGARMSPPPQGSPPTRQYPRAACGFGDSQTVHSGLSIGWGDDYPPAYAHQWMDVTRLAAGVYRICTTIDPLKEFVELDESNNQRWTDVRLDLATGEVEVLATRIRPCGPTVP
ncbi:MAG: hypothetical protein H0U21_14025 [Acidimicrobiia bacterium]|nr:hypothetical protein [Acidimicrobiia bacterium]